MSNSIFKIQPSEIDLFCVCEILRGLFRRLRVPEILLEDLGWFLL